MRQKTQLWWKEWIKLFVLAQVCWKKFSKLYVAKEYLFISVLSWSLAALVSNGKESGNWIKMVMIPVYLGNPLSLKTNPSPLLPLIYAGPPGLVKREEEIMHTCHDTGSQCLPPTPCFPSLRIFSSIKLFWTNTDLIFTHTHTQIFTQHSFIFIFQLKNHGWSLSTENLHLFFFIDLLEFRRCLT